MTKTDIPLSDAVRQTLKRLNGKMLIAGEWIGAGSGDLQAIINPATGKPFMSVPAAGAEDVDRAVVGARKAFESPDWSKMRSAHRQRLLLKLADLMADNLDEFAQLESLDNGKPVSMSKAVDVRGAIEFLRYMAGWATKIEGRTLDVSFPAPRDGGEYFAYTRREAVGVVGAIVPWNYPLSMAVWKLGPALATGCTVVLKPASETPLTALALVPILEEAGVPAGVVNVIPSRRSGAVVGGMLKDLRVRVISFTGSTEVGQKLIHAAAENVVKPVMELGGNAPFIVFDDADLDAAVEGALIAKMRNMGEA
ncbi:MAG: aldehyde dehydrogenase family protein, partial [Rhizobiaceae bacterium]|nr:aldehyde dehydrogenase family protein [Rhizobiaceae bacterium]